MRTLFVPRDDDLQHPPEEIPLLVTAMQDHGEGRFDCVYGVPREKRHSIFRNLGSSFFGWLNAKTQFTLI